MGIYADNLINDKMEHKLNGMKEEQKPTLMLAYDRLVTKARKVEELQELSERLNRN